MEGLELDSSESEFDEIEESYESDKYDESEESEYFDFIFLLFLFFYDFLFFYFKLFLERFVVFPPLFTVSFLEPLADKSDTELARDLAASAVAALPATAATTTAVFAAETEAFFLDGLVWAMSFVSTNK